MYLFYNLNILNKEYGCGIPVWTKGGLDKVSSKVATALIYNVCVYDNI